MFRQIFLFASLLSLLFFIACGRNNKDVIDKKEMVSIMIDLHKVDGILMSESFLKNYPVVDSVDIYTPVFQKHGVTREKFESSLMYYSSVPRGLERMYNRVISELTSENTRIAEELAAAARDTTGNLWKKRTNWRLPSERNDKFEVEIPLKGFGLYSFSSQIRLYKNDESVNPRISLWFWYDDGTEEGKRDSFPEIPLKKDGKLQLYKVSKQLNDTSYTHLKGRILNSDPTENPLKRQADLFQIRITYEEQLLKAIKPDSVH